MAPATAVVDRLASLLEYPEADFPSMLADCRKAIDLVAPAAAVELDQFGRAIDALSIPALQELYVSTFDLNPKCTLDVGWHLFADAYERGALLAMLREELRRHAVPEHGELPDHLPSVLMLLNRVDGSRRTELTRLLAPAFEALQTALASSGSAYAPLVKSVLSTVLAGG